MDRDACILRMTGVSKAFGGTQALSDVFEVKKGKSMRFWVKTAQGNPP